MRSSFSLGTLTPTSSQLTCENKSARNESAMKVEGRDRGSDTQKKIWIDLDNSPHVPFFVPIIEELQKRGHQIFLTGRNSYQVCELVELNHLRCKIIGGHWGRSRILKILGTCLRAAQFVPILLKAKPDLAVSHGSRAQLIASTILRIPTVTMYDYEFTAGTGFFHPDWVFVPQYLSNPRKRVDRDRILKYPGLKESVYVEKFRPDTSVRRQLGLGPSDLVATVRPPATEAHYHNEQAEILFDAALKLLMEQPGVRVVLLPRNERQAKVLQQVWRSAIAEGKIIVPTHAVNGLDLVWSSDLVISGGGTMNREAAALGVPVYSIFRGRIGAVDQYLAAHGLLVLLESVEDVQTKVKIVRRDPARRIPFNQGSALQAIVNGITSVAELQCLHL
jgi:uncharacterized protein